MRRYRGRRIHPTTAARLARQRERDERQAADRAALARLMACSHLVPLDGDEARRVWAHPTLRTFTTHYMMGGEAVLTVLRGIDGEWVIQETADFLGRWRFSRLVPLDDDAHVAAWRATRLPSLASFSIEMGAALLPEAKGAKR